MTVIANKAESIRRRETRQLIGPLSRIILSGQTPVVDAPRFEASGPRMGGDKPFKALLDRIKSPLLGEKRISKSRYPKAIAHAGAE